MNHEQFVKAVRQERLVAILRNVPLEKIDGVVDALLCGGVRVIECTFDHDQPDYLALNEAKIRRIKELYGEQVIAGCGTALTMEEVEAAFRAGAQLVISPNVSEKVIHRTRELGLVSMPGALTPSEICTAHELGADIVKLFPAGELGVGYCKAVRGPLKHIPMFAVGGIKPENVAAFRSAGICGFGVGGPLVLPDAVKSGNYSAITERAKAFTDALRLCEDTP